MGTLAIILCVIPIVTSITISPNGNSPEIKMIGGMMVDPQKEFSPMEAMQSKKVETKVSYDLNRKPVINTTTLTSNERHRRLIPYMTFYYANDQAAPTTSTTEAYTSKGIEVEKAEIVEAKLLEQSNQRDPKKIYYSAQRNIPRYQGNRLSHFNIASANPVKVYYKEVVPTYQPPSRVIQNYKQYEPNTFGNRDYGSFVQKEIAKAPSAPLSLPIRRPYVNDVYNNNDFANIRYYYPEKEQTLKYKLVPYEQTPPVRVVPQTENVYETQTPVPVPVLVSKDHIYIRPRPVHPQYINDEVQQLMQKKQPVVVSEDYYEKRPTVLVQQSPKQHYTESSPIYTTVAPSPTPRYATLPLQPAIEGGFRPMISSRVPTTAAPVYKTLGPVYTTVAPSQTPRYVIEEPERAQVVETATVASEIDDFRPNYFQYTVEQPKYKTEPYHPPVTTPRAATLTDLLNSLQLNKSVPKTITRENVGSSIKTLIQVLNQLNALKAMGHVNEVEVSFPVSTPKPYIPDPDIPDIAVESEKPTIEVTTLPTPIDDVDEEPYLAPVHTPSQHLDDFPPPPHGATSSQRFPPPVNSDDEGGTPGRPGVDYPVLTTIPHTKFNCKTQRYKGFFADPETRCQVWHYCDLNGGQASFLCPNGTIFSQGGLTCDWWFNVRCSTTTQLYVLNESLYKYILPHSPKFPEDYSGPLVDKYLTLKFKEMEEEFKKNKNKQSASDKIDSDEDDEAESTTEQSKEELSSDTDTGVTDGSENSDVSTVSEASVVVETPGTSGNVERLSD